MRAARLALPHAPSLFASAGLVCVALLTLVDRGATRAYASPWIAFFWFAHLAPFAALLLRTLPSGRPFVLPARPWLWLAAAATSIVAASALVSPHRGVATLAAFTPFAAIATFFLVHDWICSGGEGAANRLLQAAGWFFVTATAFSLTLWAADLWNGGQLRPFSTWFDYRNTHTLGHSSYTAGLALLGLPWVATLARRTHGLTRLGWASGALLVLLLLITSGSRGGLLGVGALLVLALTQVRLSWKRLLLWLPAAIALAASLALLHPRTRTMLLRSSNGTNLATSTVQRSAMLTAGWRMGSDRPLLGWGSGTTPLVYPRYRAGLDGGVENALQLHSTPVQIWADFGALGLGCLAGLLVLVIRDALPGRRRSFVAGPEPLSGPALLALAGYGTLALTDYQLDVPVFALSVAACAALVARSTPTGRSDGMVRILGLAGAGALALVVVFGSRDPAPQLNSRALSLAQAQQEAAAITLFQESLALNPDQEIAHFNLGWLLVVRDPAQAERHFRAAAQLVPDKGGVYFGIALARLNQPEAARTGEVAPALALECLNDPLFLTAPWWRQPEIAAWRKQALASLRQLADRARAELTARDDPRQGEAAYVPALAEWLDGAGPLSSVLAQSHSPERVRFFASRPAVPDFATAPGRTYRRERRAYPVLMRNLDLPTPVDLFDVQENELAADELRFLFPPKGWLPAPLLLALLDPPISAKP